MVIVEKISSREGFVSLEPVWNALLRRSDADAIAPTHEWLLTWWDVSAAERLKAFLRGRDAHRMVRLCWK